MIQNCLKHLFSPAVCREFLNAVNWGVFPPVAKEVKFVTLYEGGICSNVELFIHAGGDSLLGTKGAGGGGGGKYRP